MSTTSAVAFLAVALCGCSGPSKTDTPAGTAKTLIPAEQEFQTAIGAFIKEGRSVAIALELVPKAAQFQQRVDGLTALFTRIPDLTTEPQAKQRQLALTI